MAYSIDFRRHVLAVRDKEGLTFAQTAERFGVGIASLTRWSKRIEIKKAERRVRKIDLAKLAQDVKDHPDDFQYERAARFGVCQSAIFKAQRQINVTFKKTLSHPKVDPDAREKFQKQIKALELAEKPIVYIDESGFAKDMPRTHGYSSRGKRCEGVKDWHSKGRTNAIGALLRGVLLTVGLFEANVNADVFHAWLDQDLLKKLPPGSTLVMDNAAFHKREDILKTIRGAGHDLEFLPPYSPDLNPIEPKWAQAKAIRRKTRKSTDDIFKEKF